MKNIGFALFSVGIAISVIGAAKVPEPLAMVPAETSPVDQNAKEENQTAQRDIKQRKQSDLSRSESKINTASDVGDNPLEPSKSSSQSDNSKDEGNDAVKPVEEDNADGNTVMANDPNSINKDNVKQEEKIQIEEIKSVKSDVADNNKAEFSGLTRQTAGTWSDATPVFATGFVMALIGVILWRMGEASNNQTGSTTQSSSNDDQSPLENLYSLAVPFSQLVKNIDNLSLDELHAEVQRLLEKYLHPFVEQRALIMKQLGMQRGASLLIATAYCERMLNRVCSACADGHAQEAHSSLLDAKESFNELMNLI